jgi:hypothetical protein
MRHLPLIAAYLREDTFWEGASYQSLPKIANDLGELWMVFKCIKLGVRDIVSRVRPRHLLEKPADKSDPPIRFVIESSARGEQIIERDSQLSVRELITPHCHALPFRSLERPPVLPSHMSPSDDR